jgi:hypothetical protein
LSVVELPVIERYDPGEHAEYVVHVSASSVALNVPLAQGSQTGLALVPPDPTDQPALQLQTISCCSVPAPVCVSPGGQGVKDVHALTPEVVLKLPSSHVRQSLSIAGVPAANTYCPAMHCVKGRHMAALAVVVNPVAHGAHMRSVVAVPFACTNSPGVQTEYGAQVLSVVAVPGTET